jgi:penicillin-binding protein 1B
MRELGFIGDADHAAARRAPVRVVTTAAPGQPAPYFTDQVRLELEQRFGEDAVVVPGARVFTSVDLVLQRLAEAAVVRGLDRLETDAPRLRRRDPARRLQAALVALDPATGAVRALVGGRDYQASQFNRATQARRQPGSAFKPFVYLAALRQRGGPPALTAASLVDDEPITLTTDNEQPWTPRNYGERFEGRVTVRRALEQSLNAATVRVALTAGLPAVVETARDLGLGGGLRPVPALALGALEVTPLDLARAYTPFANGGLRVAGAWTVHTLQGHDGALVPLDPAGPVSVITAAEAYLITSLLEGVVQSGTGARVRGLGVTGSVAGKTGTTNDGRDAWFVGYTPGLLVAVWVGFDDNEPHGLPAADAAVPIWADFVRQALAAYPAGDFAVPAGVVFADVDVINGQLASTLCPVVARETFLADTLPGPCEEHGHLGEHIQNWWNRFRNWFGR